MRQHGAMPVHLDSTSRRSFLQGVAVFTLGNSIRTFGEENSDSWALLSDTHIAADRGAMSREINMADHLSRVVAEVAAEADSLSGVIIDGDCAFDDGQPGDYETLAAILKPAVDAGLPIHFTLGNHDDRDHFYGAYQSFADRSPVTSKHISVIETPLADWILLDSLRFVNKVEGEIGTAQLAWLADRLSKNPDKPALLVGHHYPQVFRTDVIPSKEKIRITGLVDSEPFLELLRTHPAAKTYIYGHSHNWKHEREASGLHQVNLPPTAYVFHPDRPSGWVRATVTPTGMDLELRSLDQDHPEHKQVRALKWR